MAPTIDMHPVNENGHWIYAVPAPLSTEAGAARIAVLVLAAIAVLAMAVVLMVMMGPAVVMAWFPRAMSTTLVTITMAAINNGVALHRAGKTHHTPPHKGT